MESAAAVVPEFIDSTDSGAGAGFGFATGFGAGGDAAVSVCADSKEAAKPPSPGDMMADTDGTSGNVSDSTSSNGSDTETSQEVRRAMTFSKYDYDMNWDMIGQRHTINNSQRCHELGGDSGDADGEIGGRTDAATVAPGGGTIMGTMAVPPLEPSPSSSTSSGAVGVSPVQSLSFPSPTVINDATAVAAASAAFGPPALAPTVPSETSSTSSLHFLPRRRRTRSGPAGMMMGIGTSLGTGGTTTTPSSSSVATTGLYVQSNPIRTRNRYYAYQMRDLLNDECDMDIADFDDVRHWDDGDAGLLTGTSGSTSDDGPLFDDFAGTPVFHGSAAVATATPIHFPTPLAAAAATAAADSHSEMNESSHTEGGEGGGASVASESSSSNSSMRRRALFGRASLPPSFGPGPMEMGIRGPAGVVAGYSSAASVSSFTASTASVQVQGGHPSTAPRRGRRLGAIARGQAVRREGRGRGGGSARSSGDGGGSGSGSGSRESPVLAETGPPPSSSSSLRLSLDAGMAALRRWARTRTVTASVPPAGPNPSRAATLQLGEEDIFALSQAGGGGGMRAMATGMGTGMEEGIFGSAHGYLSDGEAHRRSRAAATATGGRRMYPPPIQEEDENDINMGLGGRVRAFSEPDRARIRNFFFGRRGRGGSRAAGGSSGGGSDSSGRSQPRPLSGGGTGTMATSGTEPEPLPAPTAPSSTLGDSHHPPPISSSPPSSSPWARVIPSRVRRRGRRRRSGEDGHASSTIEDETSGSVSGSASSFAPSSEGTGTSSVPPVPPPRQSYLSAAAMASSLFGASSASGSFAPMPPPEVTQRSVSSPPRFGDHGGEVGGDENDDGDNVSGNVVVDGEGGDGGSGGSRGNEGGGDSAATTGGQEEGNLDPHREARARWIRVNRRFQCLITIVALIFSLLLFAILVCWVVLVSSYVVSADKTCDLPLKAYFWLATLQLILDVFRTDIMRFVFRWDANSRQRIPCRVLVYNVSYLLYAFTVLRLGVSSVFRSPTATCAQTAPELFRTTAVFVSLSLAAWSTIIIGYLGPFCFVAIVLTRNGYSPSADAEGGAMGGEGGVGGVMAGVFPANDAAPPGTVDRLRVVMLDEFPEEYPTECCICMGDFTTGEIIVATQCDHVFHKQCCQEWLYQARTCPVCRTDIPDSLQDDVDEEGGVADGADGRGLDDAGGIIGGYGDRRPHSEVAAVAGRPPGRPPMNRAEFHQEVVNLLRMLRRQEGRLRERLGTSSTHEGTIGGGEGEGGGDLELSDVGGGGASTLGGAAVGARSTGRRRSTGTSVPNIRIGETAEDEGDSHAGVDMTPPSSSALAVLSSAEEGRSVVREQALGAD